MPPRIQARNHLVPYRRFETAENITHFAILNHTGWEFRENATLNSFLAAYSPKT